MTPPQVARIGREVAARQIPDAGRSDNEAFLIEAAHDIASASGKVYDIREASRVIDWLFTLPRKRAEGALPGFGSPEDELEAAQGVYTRNGEVFVVKMNRRHDSIYAKVLVQAPDRLTEAGTTIPFELEYAPHAVADLRESDRMALADAKELMTRYGRCLYCGRHLKAAKSVEAMVGPVCAKRFRV